jgi:SAM-dependent methyltransferase/biotin operon repressor
VGSGLKTRAADGDALHQNITTCRFKYVKELSAFCRLLGDDLRLRLLRLLAREQLNVKELTAVLGIAQSGVSRHLGLLRKSGVVEERREGGYAYYSLRPQDTEGLRALWEAIEPQLTGEQADPTLRADDARLHEVLRLRKEDFLAHGSSAGQLVPGRSWAAWSRALGHLLPPLDVVDAGCGEGYLTVEAATWAARVVAVDRSKEMLRRARQLARKRGLENIAWRVGEIEQLPLDAASADVVLLSQALHHAADPARAVAEAARVTRPGGRVLVLDLRAHGQEWVKSRLGDQWLGFTDDRLADLLTGAGLDNVRVQVGARLKGDPFTVLVASGHRTDAAARPARSRSES